MHACMDESGIDTCSAAVLGYMHDWRLTFQRPQSNASGQTVLRAVRHAELLGHVTDPVDGLATVIRGVIVPHG